MDNVFIDPATGCDLVSENSEEGGETSWLKGGSGETFEVVNGIANLVFPKELAEQDQEACAFYDGRADQYDDTLHLTFVTHGLDENETRHSFIEKLNLKESSKVLEIACGTGRDSVLIADLLGEGGELHLQDLSSDMMRRCHDKLKDHEAVQSFALANAVHLPYRDNYFDAVYSFGALGEFSDQARALREMARVTRPGGKVVVGDESVPVWLRDTEYYGILKETNPMFAAEVPLQHLPVETRNTRIHYVIGQAFYLIEFEVGEGEPTANFDFPIPGARGGTYRSRYEGKLEGVTKETRELAWKAVGESGGDMHSWLDNVVRAAATESLKSGERTDQLERH